MDLNDIAFVTKNKDGNYYIGIKIKAPRGIKRRNESKANEIIIIGFTEQKFKQWLKNHNYDIIKLS